MWYCGCTGDWMKLRTHVPPPCLEKCEHFLGKSCLALVRDVFCRSIRVNGNACCCPFQVLFAVHSC